MKLTRRQLMKAGGAALALPAMTRPALGQGGGQGAGRARRLLIFYYPDGIVGPSQAGDASRWHPTGGEHDFALTDQNRGLNPFKDRCVFFKGLTSGPTDSGSHPGGAQKLLTSVDQGRGVSIDWHLSRTIGAQSPHRHVYLGAQANQNNASGDKHIVYPNPGQSTPPEDDPVRAFNRLFAGGVVRPEPGGPPSAAARRRRSLLDAVKVELDTLRGQVSGLERGKLDDHLDALREVERRIDDSAMPSPPAATCEDPALDGVPGELYAPERFPHILSLQMDVMVQAMACGLTRVGVIQASHHTSELIMSRFPGTPMHDPGFDMRSHQASHYGPRHDPGRREFRDFLLQRQWWVGQFAELLRRLDARPEGEGTMLDHTLVLMCTEVCDGNTHSHDDLPFVLAGAPGSIRTGRVHTAWGTRHSNLLTAIARALGGGVERWGQGGHGPLSGLLI